MTEKDIKKAIIYTRFAGGTDAECAAAHALQERLCRQYAQENGCNVVAVFRDVGSGHTIERPGMDSMLTFLRDNRDKNDRVRVLVLDASRLARSMSTLLVLREKIRNAGGSIEAVERGQCITARFQGLQQMQRTLEP